MVNWTFRRGFLEEVAIFDDPTLPEYDLLFHSHPASNVDFRGHEAWLPYFRRLPWLERIRRFRMSSSVENTAPVQGLLCLRQLALLRGFQPYYQNADELLPALTARPGAENLEELVDARFTLAAIQRIVSEPKLRNVRELGIDSISGTSMDGVLTELAKQPSRWQALNLPELPTTRKGAALLGTFDRLTRLRAWWPRRRGRVPDLTPNLTHLHLNAVQRDLPDPGELAKLACIPNLRELHLPVGGAPDVGSDKTVLPRLGELLQQLRGPVAHLDVRGGIAKFFETLCKTPGVANIRSLEIEGQRFSDADCRALAESDALRGLRKIELRVRMSPKRAEYLAQSPSLANLRDLDIFSFGGSIGIDGLRAILESPYLTRLRTLEIGSNALDGSIVDALIEWPRLRQLRELGLGFNRIDAASARRLGESPSMHPWMCVSLFENRSPRRELTENDLPAEVVERFGSRLRL